MAVGCGDRRTASERERGWKKHCKERKEREKAREKFEASPEGIEYELTKEKAERNRETFIESVDNCFYDQIGSWQRRTFSLLCLLPFPIAAGIVYFYHLGPIFSWDTISYAFFVFLIIMFLLVIDFMILEFSSFPNSKRLAIKDAKDKHGIADDLDIMTAPDIIVATLPMKKRPDNYKDLLLPADQPTDQLLRPALGLPNTPDKQLLRPFQPS